MKPNTLISTQHHVLLFPLGFVHMFTYMFVKDHMVDREELVKNKVFISELDVNT